MSNTDRRSLPNAPATAQISARSNNRYGAVLSSLHSFRTARAAAIASSNAAQRDAYSVVLFDHGVAAPIVKKKMRAQRISCWALSLVLIHMAVPTLLSPFNKLKWLWSKAGAQKGKPRVLVQSLLTTGLPLVQIPGHCFPFRW